MIITFILSPCPTCLSRFLDSFLLIDSPLLPPPISSGRRRSTSQLHPLPTYFPSPELRPPGRCPPPPLLASTARSAPRTACLRLPSYYAPFAPPPAASLGLHPGSYRPLGVRPSRVYIHPLCPSSLPVFCAASCHILGLGFFGCPFCVRMRVQGASTPWQSLAPAPAPLLHVHAGAVSLPGPPPPPSPS